MAVIDTLNGAASSLTEDSPSRSRPRMARRVGSARAANTSSTARGSERLYRTMWFSIESARRRPGLCATGVYEEMSAMSKKFLVLYKSSASAAEQMAAGSPDQAQEAMGLWMAWME